MKAAIETRHLTHRYGDRIALDDLNISIARECIYVFLGPNGGGKTTLFRILSTLTRPQQGSASILGRDVAADARTIRQRMGVVFQAPSLDQKLTVWENLRYQAALYGMSARPFRRRASELLAQLGLQQRVHDRTETLSGGLKRRVELAKGMIHQPELLLMDEPSTGLDPGARSDLWQYLGRLRDETGVTVVLTSHLLDEADRADRIAILDGGKLVAEDTPANLRASVGGDSLMIKTSKPRELAAALAETFSLSTSVIDGQVRLEHEHAPQLIPRIFDAFPDRIDALKLGRPTLEDVFIAKTGHRFWTEAANDGGP